MRPHSFSAGQEAGDLERAPRFPAAVVFCWPPHRTPTREQVQGLLRENWPGRFRRDGGRGTRLRVRPRYEFGKRRARSLHIRTTRMLTGQRYSRTYSHHLVVARMIYACMSACVVVRVLVLVMPAHARRVRVVVVFHVEPTT